MKEKIRCSWCAGDPIYIKYHDEEWGRAVKNDQQLFEFLLLESAQAGLSWITILKRRSGYKKAFANFDVKKVAAFTSKDIQRLMQDEGIIRNRRKIEASIANANAFIKVQKEFGSFDNYLRSFLPKDLPVIHDIKTMKDVPARNEFSDAISADMKKRGFSFFGSVICYAYLQATGYINDHLNNCHAKYK